MRFQKEIFTRDNALVRFFTEVRREELSQLYRLYSPVEDGLKSVCAEFKSQVIQTGQAIVNQAEKEIADTPKITVQNLILKT